MTNNQLKSMVMNTYRTIHGALEGYKAPNEVVPIIEFCDNARDANAKNVTIIIEDGILKMHNDGSVMDNHEFEQYQSFANTDKIRGRQIGNVGEGQKLILGADYDVTVVTINASKKIEDGGTGEFNACYWENGNKNNREIGIIDDASYKGNSADNMKTNEYGRIMIKHLKHAEEGMTVYIKLPEDKMKWLEKNIPTIIREYYISDILEADTEINMTFTYNNKKIGQHTKLNPMGEKTFKLNDNGESHDFKCKYYMSDEKLSDQTKLNNIVYTTFNKRVKTYRDQSIDSALTEEYRGRVICIARCNSLSNYVTTSKEDFKEKEKHVVDAQKKVRELFREFIVENNLTKRIQTTKSARTLGNKVVKSVVDFFANNKTYAELLPQAINQRAIARSKSGSQMGSTERTPPGKKDSKNKISTELEPVKVNNPKKPGTSKGSIIYVEDAKGELTVRNVRKRVTGLPTIKSQNCGTDRDAFFYNPDTDELLINLDREPFKSTHISYLGEFNLHSRYAIITWILQNAMANNALNMSSQEMIDFWQDVHKEPWV